MLKAIKYANETNLPLLVCGDLHDTKANIRGECIKTIINVFKELKVDSYTLVANHDRINEKSVEHSLEFIRPYTNLIETSSYEKQLKLYLIPYYSDADELREYFKSVPKGSTLIMHQGIIGSEAGHYIQDKSAITKEDVAGLRVISGHYHKRQTIKLPDNGTFDYIGNPYTLGFGEAKDPEKGFQILHDDGSLSFVPTNLRKHVIIEADLSTDTEEWFNGPIMAGNGVSDLVWLKVNGTKEELNKFNKTKWLRNKGIIQNVRLDLIPTETTTYKQQPTNVKQEEVLDNLIESLTNTTSEQKQRLKSLWKEFI
jgi:DNA repair exonuclease SbcCD nuclease subunit